jgi:cell wall-associated NlpC family hydrolase
VTLIATVLISANSVGASPTASSNGSQSVANGGTVAGTQAQVATIEAQIAQQQLQIAALSEQFDQSTVHLQQVQTQLALIHARLAADRGHLRVAQHLLQEDAVNAYVDDVPASDLSSLFSSASPSGALHEEYQNAAIGNVDAAVAGVESSEHQLLGTQGRLRAEVEEANAETTAVHQSEEAAQSATSAAESTLSDVKGQLAEMIAQQAAQHAAEAAEAAESAANEAARRRAAQQASDDAQVAQTVGGGSAAATAATNYANQAAGAAGAAGVVGSGGPETARGAGSVALTAAERYLGVPYEYGGASMSGVDCSGLTMLAWHAAGVSLFHSAAIQRSESTPVPLSQVQPGDLLFYDLGGDGVDHVVLYVGSGPYGADTIIQAAHTGTVVAFAPIWYFGLVGAGRP